MITKIILTMLFVLNFNFILYSQVTQEWVATYNGSGNFTDRSNAIAVDDSGNVYVTGSSSRDTINTDYATVKYNQNGMQIWAVSYNGTGDSADDAYAIVVDKNYNVYVTGRSVGKGSGFDIVTIKYNSSGKLQWLHRDYNGFDATQIAADNYGNVYVAGQSDIGITTYKFDYNGVLLWRVGYHNLENGTDFLGSMCIDNSSNTYITGSSEGSNSDLDIVTIKYNSVGKKQWIQRYNGIHNYKDYSNSVTADNYGNVYVTGGTFIQNSPISDCITIKYDNTGNQLWLATYNGPLNDFDMGISVKTDEIGNVYVAGQSIGAWYDILALKYNSFGMQQWVLRHHEYLNDNASSMVIDKTGNMYIAGGSQNTNGYFDFFTLKCNTNGTLVWTKRYQGSSYYSEGINGLATDSLENVFVTGPKGENYANLDYTTIKYSQPIGIQPISSKIPAQFSLSQNYPNPFNPSTKIQFQIPLLRGVDAKGRRGVLLKVYDILGREIATLVNEKLQPGMYEVEWDASNYPSGVYLYRIASDEFSETKKMIIVK